MSAKRDLPSASDHEEQSETIKKSRSDSNDQYDCIQADATQNAQTELDGRSRKSKQVEFEQLYLANLPSSEGYERSYMHREHITHVVSASKSDFVITGKLFCLFSIFTFR